MHGSRTSRPSRSSYNRNLDVLDSSRARRARRRTSANSVTVRSTVSSLMQPRCKRKIPQRQASSGKRSSERSSPRGTSRADGQPAERRLRVQADPELPVPSSVGLPTRPALGQVEPVAPNESRWDRWRPPETVRGTIFSPRPETSPLVKPLAADVPGSRVRADPVCVVKDPLVSSGASSHELVSQLVVARVDLYWLPLGVGDIRCGSTDASTRPWRRGWSAGQCAISTTLRSRYTCRRDGSSSNRHRFVIPERARSEALSPAAPSGRRWAGHFRIFRYEVRCWRDGVIPDIVEAVASPGATER